MATERKTTGASPLLDIIREVYYTKRRMKYVLMDFTDTDSEDFEEYAQLTSWVLVDQYNKGYANGYIDGWHVVFPEDEVDEDEYSDGYKEYPAPFEPSIPQYSTDTYIDNLVDIMRDNLRCRLLLKAALHTASDEFVTYPDLLEEGAETEYDTGYNLGYQTGLDKATDLSFGKPIIVHVRGSNTVQIIPNAQISGTTLYYWTGSSAERHEYTGEFYLDHSDIVYATNMLNGRIGPIASQYCDILDYSEINYATVRLPVGVASAKFSVKAVVYGSGTIYPVGGYGGQYSYDKVNWYDIPITSQSGWPYQYLEQIKSFTLSGTNNEMYFKAKNFGNGCYSLLFFDSTKEWIETGHETAPAGSEWAGETVYFVYSRNITNPTSIDIAANWRDCRVSQLLIKSAQYAYAINDKLAGHTETKRGADMIFEIDDHSGLFAGCTGMNYICCLGFQGLMNTTGWTSNVAPNGTFVKLPTTTWSTGTSGIPSGWSTFDRNLDIDSTLPVPSISQNGNTVTISEAANNIMIYYTASNPTLHHNVSYSERYGWEIDSTFTINISDTDTFYAFIVGENGKSSTITVYNAVYQYSPVAPTVTQSNNTITITNNEGAGTLYYSLDDGVSWTQYNAPFAVDDIYTIIAKVDTSEVHPTWGGNVATTTFTNIYYLNYAPTVTLDTENLTFTITNNDPNTKGTLWYSINGGTYVQYNGETSFDIYTDDIIAYYTYGGQTSPLSALAETNFGLVITFPNGGGTLQCSNSSLGCPDAKYKLNDSDEWVTFNPNVQITGINKIILRNFERPWSSAPQNSLGTPLFYFNAHNHNISGYLERLVKSDSNDDWGCAFTRDEYLISASDLIIIGSSRIDSYLERMFDGCKRLTGSPTLPSPQTSFCFSGMFKGCTALVNAPALPATTLPGSCYYGMFENCTALTTAPALPATTLAPGCYCYMFRGCTALVNAPALPATSLADYCYRHMFENCTALVNAPALPASTLATYCYNEMFKGCTALVNAPALPATTLATYCYDSMFYGCTSLSTAPALPATTLADYCYEYMFYECTSLTTAPELPATTLVNNCYDYMFTACTNLNYVKCMAIWHEWGGDTTNWLLRVSVTGTFVQNAAASWIEDGVVGDSGIPTGWTVVDAA